MDYTHVDSELDFYSQIDYNKIRGMHNSTEFFKAWIEV